MGWGLADWVRGRLFEMKKKYDNLTFFYVYIKSLDILQYRILNKEEI